MSRQNRVSHRPTASAYSEEWKRLKGRSPFPRVKLLLAHYRDGKVAATEMLESR